jgi:hypothetical protein
MTNFLNSDSIAPTTRWKIRIDKSAFDKLKTDESFWGIVVLSRIVNALRFVHSPLVHFRDGSPSAERFRYNSFLFNCALLYEASEAAPKLGKHFHSTPEFQEMVSVLKTHQATRIFETNLYHLRNGHVFHFSVEETQKQMTKLELEEPIFVSAMGETNEQVYYELADLCAISTFTGTGFPNNDADIEALKVMMEKITTLTLEFLAKAEDFIGVALEDRGWEMVTISESTVPQSPA